MPTQTATTGKLENAQGVIIAATRYAAEHSMPCVNLIEHMKVKKGNKQITVPFVGQMTMHDLVDGVPIVTSEDIGLTTVDLTTGEVGMRVVLTKKLVFQENEDVFNMIGKQIGSGEGRKKNKDVIALFSALNSGTAWGADDKNMTVTNLSAAIAKAHANKILESVRVVHHPNAVYAYVSSLAVIPSTTYPLPHGIAEDLLRDFYGGKAPNGTPIFEDGNIEKISGVDSGYGAIFEESAMVYVDGYERSVDRSFDADLRGWKIVLTDDYGVFELDDLKGAPLRYEIGDPATNN